MRLVSTMCNHWCNSWGFSLLFIFTTVLLKIWAMVGNFPSTTDKNNKNEMRYMKYVIKKIIIIFTILNGFLPTFYYHKLSVLLLLGIFHGKYGNYKKNQWQQMWVLACRDLSITSHEMWVLLSTRCDSSGNLLIDM